MVKWTAALSQAGASLASRKVPPQCRAHSTIFRGGIGTLLISPAELVGALLVPVLTLAALLAALALVILFLWLAVLLLRWLFRGPHASNGEQHAPFKR